MTFALARKTAQAFVLWVLVGLISTTLNGTRGSQAHAGFGLPGTCGTACLSMMNGGFQPFYGTPWLGSPYNGYGMTGEMDSYEEANPIDPRLLALSYQMNWPGSQPLGLGSYMPPIGGAAIYNKQNFKAFSGYMEAMGGL